MKSLNSNGDCAGLQLLPSHSHTPPSHSPFHFSLPVSLAAEVCLLSPSRHVSLLIFSPHFLCLISKKDICLSELYMLVRWEELDSSHHQIWYALFLYKYFYGSELLFQFKLWFFFLTWTAGDTISTSWHCGGFCEYDEGKEIELIFSPEMGKKGSSWFSSVKKVFKNSSKDSPDKKVHYS